MPALIVKTGPRAGTVFNFDTMVTLGRGRQADIALEDQGISRHHALVRVDPSAVVVVDQESKNGTLLNGRLIPALQPAALRDGDQVKLGAVVLEYRESLSRPSGESLDHSLAPVPDNEISSSVVFRVDAESVSSADGAPSGPAGVAELTLRLQFFERLSRMTAETVDEAAFLNFVTGQLFELLPQAERVLIVRYEPATQAFRIAVARTRTGDTANLSASRTLLREAIDKRQGILSSDATGDQQLPATESFMALKLRSVMCAPMLAGGEVYGVIQVDTSQVRRPFGKADMTLATGLAGQVAACLANTALHHKLMEQELMRHDLDLARRIQQRFLPRDLPQVGGMRFAIAYRPALAVGGDLYEILTLDESHIGVAVGDVSGKGVSGALYMARLTSDIRYHSVGLKEPAEVLKRVNRALLRDIEASMFVTACYMVVNRRSGELKTASAGHPAALLRRADGSVASIGGQGATALGIEADSPFETSVQRLVPGDVVTLFTDGVSEAQSREGHLFGVDRLGAALRSAGGTPEECKNAVLDAIDRFFAGHPQNDDITVVCFGPSPDF